MPKLTLRPTRLYTSPAFQHLQDWTVHEDSNPEPIGRIYEIHGPVSPEETWYWALQITGAHEAGMRTNGRARGLDGAKEAFQNCYDNYRAWKASRI